MKPPIVFIIDDDASVRKSLTNLMTSAGYSAKSFTNGHSFFDDYQNETGCIILDLNMPEEDGLMVQQQLLANDCFPPVIFLSGFGNVFSTACAFKNGAIDFLEKPVDDELLIITIDKAIKIHQDRQQKQKQQQQFHNRLVLLTERETEILRYVISGRLNKQIAADLTISEKTVKVHRARIMEKIAVQSVAELVRLTEQAGIQPMPYTSTEK